MFRRIGQTLLVLALLVPALGCTGSKTNRGVTVSGKVVYKNAPVTGGTLMFHLGGAAYPVAIKPDGTYSSTQLPAGEAIVEVSTEALNPERPKYAGKGMPDSTPPGVKKGVEGVYVKIPDKYTKKDTTDIKLTLVNGPNNNNIELKD